MLRNSLEIAPDCRECLGVSRKIAELALLQTEYGQVYRQCERRSEAQASVEGRSYVRAEEAFLDILELGTFCNGQINGLCGLDNAKYGLK